MRISPLRASRFAAAGVFGAAIVGGGWLVQRGTSRNEPSAFETARLFDEVRRHVVRDYVDSIPDSLLYRKAVDGVLFELGDPYTTFLPPARLQRLSETTSGSYNGTGLQVDIRDSWVIVMATLPASPAERGGLEPGDRLLEISDRSTENWTIEEAGLALRGPPGTPVRLLVDRVGVAEPFRVTLRRARVHVSAVRRAAMLTRDVGYVELRAFSDSTAPEVRRAVEGLIRGGMRSLILDLRANPGGLLDEGVRVADLFLDRNAAIVHTRARAPEESRDYVDPAPQRWPWLPLTVLVDGRSASAAEIVAGALQDHDRAAIVGTPTYGKGSAQTLFPIADGALKLTTARWYTPVGRSIARRIERERGGPFELFDERPTERPKFKTLGGRTIRGGGGIVPDEIVGDTLPDEHETALSASIAGRAQRFNDALSEFALSVKRGREVTRADFMVTPAMLDALYDRLRGRGLEIPRMVYDDAAPVIQRLLSYEIARFVFGPDAEFRRRANDDRALRAALRVASGARTTRDPLRRVAGASADGVERPPG